MDFFYDSGKKKLTPSISQTAMTSRDPIKQPKGKGT